MKNSEIPRKTASQVSEALTTGRRLSHDTIRDVAPFIT